MTAVFNKWMVFVGAYAVMVFDVGFLYSMGKLFVIILDTFHDTRAVTATIQTVVFNKWMVFVGAYVVMVFDVGFLYSMGKLFVIVIDKFHDTRAATATIQSVTFGVSQASGIISGAFVHKFGPRKASLLGSLLIFIGLALSFLATSVVYLTFSMGICFALGLSLAYISCTSAVGMYFDDKSSLVALSVLSTGSGVGGMMYPYLIDILNEQYSLPGMLLIIGGLTSHGLASSLLYGAEIKRHLPNKSKNVSNGIKTICTSPTGNSIRETSKVITINDNKTSLQNRSISDKETTNTETTVIKPLQSDSGKTYTIFESMRILFRNKCFIFFAVGCLFIFPALNCYKIVFVDIFKDKGFTEADASFGLVLFNIFSQVGRLSPGLLSRLPCISTLTLPIIASCTGILAILALIFVESFTLTILCTCIMGVTNGVFTMAFSVTTAALVGRYHLSNGIGVLFTLNSVPNLAFGPISGMLRDMTGSYSVVFITAAVMMGAGLLMFVLAQYLRSQNKSSQTMIYSTKL